MSEGSPARIDPRFDARFQRGYVPDEPAGLDAESQPPGRAAAEHPESVTTTTRPAASRPVTSTVAAARTTTDDDAGPDRPAAGDAEFVEMLAWAGADEGEPSRADPWFLGAWTVSVVAVALGAALAMAGMMTETYTGGPSAEGDRWLQVVGWTVAPSMVQGGLLGVVGMLVWTGLRHARRAGGGEEPG